LGSLAANHTFFAAGANAGNTDNFQFAINATNNIKIYSLIDTSELEFATETYRDPAAWYHFVCVVDTTQATASNRVKLYVNGLQKTSPSGTQPVQNSNLKVNTISEIQHIGRYYTGATSQLMDGYIANMYLIDGQALTPSSFGQTNTNGVWVPKA
jgi:hypothetical protein